MMKNILALIAILFATLAGGVPATIGGVRYDNVDEGEPFTEAPAQLQMWNQPAPYLAERHAGLMAFVARDPGEYIPARVPRSDEHVRALDAFVSQGETTCITLGVRSLKRIDGLCASMDMGGAPATAEVMHMHCWPQRTGWKSRQWYMTPELLLPFANGKRTVPAQNGVLAEEAFDLESGKTVGLWITVKTSPEARPGKYKAVLSISGHGMPALKLPVKLEILPIALQRPADKNWLLYADPGRWSAMSEEQVLAELKDFAAHGFNGLVEGPFGSLDLSEIRAGRVRFDDAPYRKIVAQCKAAGMPGPHVCQLGGIPQKVRDALGVQCDVAKDAWPEALRRGVTDVARAVMEATKDAGARWYFYGVDEPTGDNTYAIQEYQCWHEAGVPTYATFYKIDFLDKASGYLTTPCFVSALVSKESKAKEAREGCARNKAEFWWYGTGCYVNPSPQEGGMFFNRYGAGLFFWKTGAVSQVTWTFCRPHADVFNDFDGTPQNSAEPKEQATAYPHLLRPNDWSTYQGAIPTVAWESLREGYNDYLYLSTLKGAIEKARANGDKALKRKADKAEKVMAGLVESVPLHNPMSKPPRQEGRLASSRLQAIRHAVAEQILALRD